MEYLDTLINSDLTKLLVILLIVVPLYFQIGILKRKNGTNNGNTEENFKELAETARGVAETANHSFTKLTEKFAEHTEADAREFGKSEEFRHEVRDFMREQRNKK